MDTMPTGVTQKVSSPLAGEIPTGVTQKVSSPLAGEGQGEGGPLPRSFWFAVCSKPRQEAVAEENLMRQGFYVYLPRLRIRRRRRGQWIDSIEVLFPRSLFIRIDPVRQNLAPVRSTRGVIGLVRFGGQPAVVPDEVMDALLQCQDPTSGFHQENLTPYSAGDRIKLVDGPFAGMEAVFAEPDGEKRVIVLLELMGKTNQVRVSRDWVAKAA